MATILATQDGPVAPRVPDAALSASAAHARLLSIDLLRGLVIMLMALDHVRDYFFVGSGNFDPLDVDKTTALVFATRWITHFCAPTFVLLAGISAWLNGARMADSRALAKFLLTRGLWLILLESTVVSFGWNFTTHLIVFQVIWAIGASMILLAPFAWAGPRAALVAGAVIIAGHNALDAVTATDLGAWAVPFDLALNGEGFAMLRQGHLLVGYPALPWAGIILLGYGLGPLFRRDPAARVRTLRALGVVFVAGFLALRLLHAYGDANGWTGHARALQTLGDLLDTTKYPPSLHYTLMTLGPVLLLLPTLEHLRGPVARVLLTYGRVPLFFYVLHLFLVHGLQYAAGTTLGYPAHVFTDLFSTGEGAAAKAGWGVPLWATYLVWAAVLAVLYPACAWFGRVKARRRDWWLSYL